MAVHDIGQIKMLEQATDVSGTVWLKFDTGMNRLGFRPENAQELLRRLDEAGSVSESIGSWLRPWPEEDT